MSEEELYTGVDRGHFKIMRLIDNSGVQLRVNCRLKEVTVFNYLSDLQYAIIGYSVEWWPEGQPGPHQGGDAHPFIPRNRPNISKLYMRAKTSITPKMLHLEDAIINDFMNVKMLADPMTFLTYSMEAAEQIASSEEWRSFDDSPYQYANAVHITKFEATASTPLTVVSEGMRFTYRRATMPEAMEHGVIQNSPFTKLRDCYTTIEAYIKNEVANGNF